MKTELTTHDLWADCGTTQIEKKVTTRAGFCVQFQIPNKVRRIYDIEGGDSIEVRVKYDGQEVVTECTVATDAAGFVLPASERKTLRLDVGDEPEFWLRPAPDSSHKITGRMDADLSEMVGEENDVEYVMLVNLNSQTLHAKRETGKTLCGKSIGDANMSVNVASPGDVSGEFSECRRCVQALATPLSFDESHQRLDYHVDGIEYSESSPTGYISKAEMLALVYYIEELKYKAGIP
jgi:bifunctional DNA-binding transcriptional regulator/antitoxin component of YhaV-PrlF toxin-antitoxin module